VPARAERKEDDPARPDVDGRSLSVVVEQSFGRHVSLGARSVSDFELLLQLTYFLHRLVVFVFHGLSLLVKFELTEAEVDEQPSLGVLVVQEV